MAFSLLWGTLFFPLNTRAGIFSSFFGNQAVAGTDTALFVPANENSQTIALLEASVFSVSDSKEDKTAEIMKNTGVDIVSENALLPSMSLASASGGATGSGELSFDQVSVYVVRNGDSLSQIAEMFNVSVNTILSANDMKKGDKIHEGDVLVILPISGIEHTVTKGQTLQSIAKLYKVDITDITLYNGLTEGAKLAIGDELIIPGAEMYPEGDKPVANLSTSVAADKNYYATHPIQSLTGYFVNPLPTGKKTQGLHGPGKRGIDIGAPTGTPIYASASGTVLIAKTGWSGGYGNMAIIQHSNGTKTLYAHMSKLGTSTGAPVSAGDVIGYVGSTGHSTGPHLHFEVFNAKNPGSDGSWKK